MKRVLLQLFLYGTAFSAGGQTPATTSSPKESTPIIIEWKSPLAGNFSFTKKWDYPEGVERLPTGKPGCADGGFCPPRAQAMQDKNGRVPKDSLAVFYSLVDTTHRHHSFAGEARCYEYAGTSFINASRSLNGIVTAQTEGNVATHCLLQLAFAGDTCRAQILLQSVTEPGEIFYYASGGHIQADLKAWEKGLLKANFHFTFTNTSQPDKPLFWKGRIYTLLVEGEK